jgi:hypothetical protein
MEFQALEAMNSTPGFNQTAYGMSDFDEAMRYQDAHGLTVGLGEESYDPDGVRAAQQLFGAGSDPPELTGIQLSKAEAAKWSNFVNSQYDKMKSARSKQERQWYLNMAMYYGRQNVILQNVSGAGTRLIVPPAPPWRVRMVINKIRPIVRRELAKLTSQKPSASVIPASSDDADLFAANAAEQIWESQYQIKDVKRDVQDAVWWALVCGTGYLKTFWDQSQTYSPNPDVTYQGDICYAAETPFHVLVPDLRQIRIEGQPYIIHSSTRSVEWLRNTYPKALDGSEIRPNTKSANDILNDAYLNLLGTTHEFDSVLVHEMHIKPGGHKDFPEGGIITVTGDQVVQYMPIFPYQHGEFCFAKIDHIPSGKYYATSVIEDLIPIQREYNRTRSQVIEAKNRMAKPQMSAQMGSVDVSKITTEPGQFILYKPGFNPPQPIPLQGLPSYVLQEIQQLNADFDDLSGQHETSRGNVPAGVTAATAISYLQEQDDSMLSAEVDSIESAMEKVAKQTLSLVGQYWDIPRIVKVTGIDGSWDAAMLKGSDLNNNYDIRMEAGSALPTSKAAKQALITDWMKLGFITPEEGMQVLEIGGIVKLYERIKIDENQARRENLKMQNVADELIQQMLMPPTDPMTGEVIPQVDPMSGKPLLPEPVIPVNTWDNHAIHIDIHNRYRKSQAFESLDPMKQLLFEIHVQKHMEAIAAPHIGGMPTAEMMIGVAEQQRNQPPPTDSQTPMMGGEMGGEEGMPTGPVPEPETESAMPPE